MGHSLATVCVIALGTLGAWGCSGNDEPVVGSQTPAFTIETGPFEVAAGQEVQNCHFFEVVSDEPMHINRIQVRQNEGTHHMNVFRVKTILELGGAPGDVIEDGECWNSANWADWPLVTNSQTEGDLDWQLPEGVAHRFEPRELLMLQTHYVNTAAQDTPVGGDVNVDFFNVPEAEVHHELGTVFATNQEIRICPGEDKRYETTCRFAQEDALTIVAATGHFHDRGTRFRISTFDPIAGSSAPFYESTAWDEPPFLRDLSVQVPAGGGISYSCEYSAPLDGCGDPNDSCCFTFGGFVDFQEHCNAFVYFFPGGATDYNCF